MQYLLLTMTTCLMSVQSIISKQYSIHAKRHNPTLYVSLQGLAAMLTLAISAGFQLHFSWDVLPYSIAFGTMYFASSVCSVLAIKCGPFALSNLINAYSQMIPTLFGIVFLKEPISQFAYVGIAFLVLSIFLINSKKEEFRFSLAWLILISISFLANGLCATVSKMQQLAFDGQYKSEYMIAGLLITFLSMLVVTLIRRKDALPVKECAVYAMPAGALNGLLNLGILFLTGMVPNALLFPCLSAGGIILSFIAAVFIYKERLSAKQIIGFIFGVLAVIALNL